MAGSVQQGFHGLCSAHHENLVVSGCLSLVRMVSHRVLLLYFHLKVQH